jgi:hypothetical protein
MGTSSLLQCLEAMPLLTELVIQEYDDINSLGLDVLEALTPSESYDSVAVCPNL